MIQAKARKVARPFSVPTTLERDKVQDCVWGTCTSTNGVKNGGMDGASGRHEAHIQGDGIRRDGDMIAHDVTS